MKSKNNNSINEIKNDLKNLQVSKGYNSELLASINGNRNLMDIAITDCEKYHQSYFETEKEKFEEKLRKETIITENEIIAINEKINDLDTKDIKPVIETLDSNSCARVAWSMTERIICICAACLLVTLNVCTVLNVKNILVTTIDSFAITPSLGYLFGISICAISYGFKVYEKTCSPSDKSIIFLRRFVYGAGVFSFLFWIITVALYSLAFNSDISASLNNNPSISKIDIGLLNLLSIISQISLDFFGSASLLIFVWTEIERHAKKSTVVTNPDYEMIINKKDNYRKQLIDFKNRLENARSLKQNMDHYKSQYIQKAVADLKKQFNKPNYASLSN